ncbi:ATP-binding protein [Pseudomonas sp. NPDC090202]|uniref:ATP-binding protein n=1 Tax=unclassified Pseudomonas TaxID=196821 RepID=UPI00382969EC
MFKMLTRLYLILLVTYSVALYAIPEVVLKLFDTRNVTYNMEQAKGTMLLIQQRFQQRPVAEWPGLEAELKRAFAPLELRVVPLADASLNDREREMLRDGRNAVRLGYYGTLGTVLAPLDQDQAVELVAPDPPLDIYIMYWLMNILIGAALLACLLFWVRPHWNDLQRLKRTAIRLGQGHLGVRTQISPRSNIGELAQVFDTMAQDIEGLLNQKQELLNAVSHELRTPLSRLEFGLALVSADELPTATRQRVEQMVGHVRELDTLIDELLSYTRLQSPYQRIEPQDVAVPAYLDSVLGGFVEQQERQGFRLHLYTDNAPQRWVLDPRLTARALENLIANAVRYCESRIDIHVDRHVDNGLAIRIDDDGIGIPEQERELIFEPFYRMDRSRDRDTGGFGLGLAISRRAIECQGGTLTVSRSPEGGARFEILLPWRRDDEGRN